MAADLITPRNPYIDGASWEMGDVNGFGERARYADLLGFRMCALSPGIRVICAGCHSLLPSTSGEP
jgi:hypothetical protein